MDNRQVSMKFKTIFVNFHCRNFFCKFQIVHCKLSGMLPYQLSTNVTMVYLKKIIIKQNPTKKMQTFNEKNY